MKLIDNIRQDEELANQLLELDESEHSEIKLQQLINMESLAENVDRYVFVMKTIEAKIDFLKDQKKQLDQFIKSLENKQENFKSFITSVLVTNDITEAIGQTKKISVQERTSLTFEESEIPKEYFREVISTELNKEKILLDVAAGKDVPGVSEKKTTFIKSFNNSSTKVGILKRKDVQIENQSNNQ